jgi:glycosyltransferase involved in cell wall biosynthesis
VKYKIAIAVHGRFHAFDFARALIAQGHDVTLFTNYPPSAVESFGIARSHVRSFVRHGLVARVLTKVGLGESFERYLHTTFGRWAARQLQRDHWDVIYSWSGVSEEILRTIPAEHTLRLVVRGSAHIRSQWELLRDEQVRTGARQEQPSPWRIEREEREYAAADGVIVLSSFCKQTFLDHGFPEDRLGLMVSATRVEVFRPPPEVIADRCRHILSGAPLRVLNVGTFSYRKGIYDWAEMLKKLDPARYHFRFVGSILPEAKALARSLQGRVEFVPRLPQAELPGQYAWADLFMLPTIEDGFPAVSAQAAAAGLPILTTPNGAGHDVVLDGETGWIVPARDAPGFASRLQWCDASRRDLSRVVQEAWANFQPRDWEVAARDFTLICARLIDRKRRRSGGTKHVKAVPPKIAFVVQGRFYIFDLARELIKQGVDVTVLTNYPKFIAERFGVPGERVRNCVLHGVASRFVYTFDGRRKLEPMLHRWFSRWAIRALRDDHYTMIQCLSGVAEEVFASGSSSRAVRALVRGSSHIEAQEALLRLEEQRAGKRIDKPTRWMMARENREYKAADVVFVLSSFAYGTFIDRGFPHERLRLLPLGSTTAVSRTTPIEERCRRIESGQRLRVLCVGTFSYRKGALDLVEIARLASTQFDFMFVGAVTHETWSLQARAQQFIRFLPRQRRDQLEECYAWADLFVFPTIEDGFAAVLAEAQGAGLPILATTNCAASDIVRDDQTGWVLPIHDPQAFVDRLRWCDAHRQQLVEMVRSVSREVRDWSEVAREFLDHHAELVAAKRPMV